SCHDGFDDCNHDRGDGCEVDLAEDPTNCGTCGAGCAVLANATVACRMRLCAIDSCNPGFADCDALVADGCETAVQSDPDHCGACGQHCVAPNGIAARTKAQCGLA